MNFTEDQRRVIDTRGSNLLVSAAAGSGKTAVLVARIMSRLTDPQNPADIDRLLIVTFTKAAAGEMRTRIMKAIAEERERQPENEHLAAQAALIHHAQITTIDGFCSYVVRSYGHTIGLAPGFRIAEQGEMKLLQHDVAGAVLEEAYAAYADGSFPELADCVETLAPQKTDVQLEQDILRLYNAAQSDPYPDSWLAACLQDNLVETEEELAGTQWLQEYMQDARERAKSVLVLAEENLAITERSDGPAAYKKVAVAQLELLRALLAGESYREWYEALRNFDPGRLPGGRAKSTEDPSLREAFKNNREMIKAEIEFFEKGFCVNPDEILSDIRKSAGPLSVLVRLVQKFSEAYRTEKQRRGIMEFADLEHSALQILRDENGRTDTARELAGLYDEVMVDEYQDSNYLQEEILTAVSRIEDGGMNYFCVGDVKQSIYSFRQARPDLFMKKYHLYPEKPEAGTRIDLHMNFRSRREVLESVNGIFRQIMRPEIGGIAYDDDAALVVGADYETTAVQHASADHPESASGETEKISASAEETAEIIIEAGEEQKEAVYDFRTELLPVFTNRDDAEDDAAADSDGVQPKAALEARAIGGRISELVAGGRIRDDKTKEMRPVRYRDIVILMRSMSAAETYVKVLEDMQIPAYAERKGGYFAALEVRNVLSFLSLLDNAQNDIAAAAVFRSAFVGLNAEQLAAIRTTEGVRSWTGSEDARYLSFYDQARAYAESGSDDETRQKLQKYFAFYDKMRGLMHDAALHELVYRILTESGYLDYAAALPGGAQRVLNLRMLVDRAAEFEKTSYTGLFNFIRYFENLKKQEADLDELGTVSEDEDVVRIYTIHKSKGLEYPIVFLAETSRGFNRRDSNANLLIHPVFGIAADYIDLETRLRHPTLRRAAIRERMERDRAGEELRVLYVALTRAKQKLIITGAVKDEEELKKLELLMPLREMLFSPGVLTRARSFFAWLYPAAERMIRRAELKGEPCSVMISPVTVQTLSMQAEAGGLHREEMLDELRYMRADAVYDREAREALLERFRFVYPYAGRENIPVEVSVSELKHKVWEALEEEKQEEQVWQLYEEETGNETYAGADEAEAEQSAGQAGMKPDQNEEAGEVSKPSFEPTVPEFMKKKAASDENTEEAENGKHRLSGAARGTAYHLVMELLDFRRTLSLEGRELAEEIKRQMQDLQASGRLDAESAAAVRQRDVAAFAESELGRRYAAAQAAGQLHREQPFVMELPASEIRPDWPSDETVCVQGIIDAYFREERGLVLLDYKTDRVRRAEELVERYRIQLQSYAEALSRAEGREVGELWIWSFALKQAVKV